MPRAGFVPTGKTSLLLSRNLPLCCDVVELPRRFLNPVTRVHQAFIHNYFLFLVRSSSLYGSTASAQMQNKAMQRWKLKGDVYFFFSTTVQKVQNTMRECPRLSLKTLEENIASDLRTPQRVIQRREFCSRIY